MLDLIIASMLAAQGAPAPPAKPQASAPPAVQAVEGRLTLRLGQAVTVRLERSGSGVRPAVVQTEPAAARMRESVLAIMAERSAAAQREVGDQENVAAITGVPPQPPAADQVRLTFGMGPDGRSVLLIAENGYDRVVDYRAVMRLADGRSAPTTICQVPAKMRMAESWSDPIVVLELSEFEFVAPGPDPARNVLTCD